MPNILILANGDAIDACLITSARVARNITVFPDDPDRCLVLIGCGTKTFDVTFHDVDEANAERDRVIAAWRAATDEAKPVEVDEIEDVAATWALERWDTWAVDLLGKSGDIQDHGRQNLRTAIDRRDMIKVDGQLHSRGSIVHELADRAKDRDIARKRCCLLASESEEDPEFDERHYAAQYGWSYLYPET